MTKGNSSLFPPPVELGEKFHSAIADLEQVQARLSEGKEKTQITHALHCLKKIVRKRVSEKRADVPENIKAPLQALTDVDSILTQLYNSEQDNALKEKGPLGIAYHTCKRVLKVFAKHGLQASKKKHQGSVEEKVDRALALVTKAMPGIVGQENRLKSISDLLKVYKT